MTPRGKSLAGLEQLATLALDAELAKLAALRGKEAALRAEAEALRAAPQAAEHGDPWEAAVRGSRWREWRDLQLRALALRIAAAAAEREAQVAEARVAFGKLEAVRGLMRKETAVSARLRLPAGRYRR